MANHYDVIGVPFDASTDEIRAAYRQRLRTVHPDFHQGAAPDVLDRAKHDTVELNEAWYVLGDPVRRAAYDVSAVSPSDIGRTASGPPTVVDDADRSLCPHCGTRNATSDSAERATCRNCGIEYGLSKCRFCRTTTPLPLDQNLYRCPGCHKSERPPWASMGTPRATPRAAPAPAAAPGRSTAPRSTAAPRRARPTVRARLSASGMLTGAAWVLLAAVLVAGIGVAASIGDVTVLSVQLLALAVLIAWLVGRFRNRRP